MGNLEWYGLTLVIGILIACIVIWACGPKPTVSYETYENAGYEDAKNGVPLDLCEYVGVDHQWYLRGYKKGWKEINGKS